MKIKQLTDIPSVRAYLNRVGAEPRSLKTAVIRVEHGAYWKDVAVIRFARNGQVVCTAHEFSPTETEEQVMAVELQNAQWPEPKPLPRLPAKNRLPKMIAEADRGDIFEFRNDADQIIMLQVRVENPEGKNYVPWTFWDDEEWRCCEPDGPLPLYNAQLLKSATVAYIHEGAKAARAVQQMVDAADRESSADLAAHPWGAELEHAVHLGWVGGAMSPYRTDWSPLQKHGIKRVYIVADNDEPGRSAVPGIAQQLHIPTFLIQFTQDFPPSFDLADAFPERMFKRIGATRHYVGPSWRECLHPATWATDLIPQPKGKPRAVLRDCFKQMWAYVENADAVVCTEMPEIMHSETTLNKVLAPFSHVADTCKLIYGSYRGRHVNVCYRPDKTGLMITSGGSSAINLHVPSTVRESPGDAEPWEEFLRYMFVNEDEREWAARWCATLIARPDIRMGYGMLLVSEAQGIGKTTLGSFILAPLVGAHNVGYPAESSIVQSAFNGWLANKRLVVVNEIYSGSSWKAYNMLKSAITDTEVSVNQKYMREYTTENWAHILACSNSMRALKMENDDRRWLYPEMTEVPWPGKRFGEFRQWVESGGLSIIKSWAHDFCIKNGAVRSSDRAPMTARKRELIEGSRSEAQAEAAALAEAMRQRTETRVAMSMRDIVAWVRASAQSKVFDTDYELRRAMKDSGAIVWHERVRVQNRQQYVLMNRKLLEDIESDRVAGTASEAPQRARDMIRASITPPQTLLEEGM